MTEEKVEPLFTLNQLLKLEVGLHPGWQFDNQVITTMAVIHPRYSRPSRMSGLADFRGITTVASCGSPDESRLAELPAAEEKKVRRAAYMLQQKLILRHWLTSNHIVSAYPSLTALDVCSLEDVYWLEDKVARHVLDPLDFPIWCAARQTLPISPEHLQSLKADLWSAVIKNSRHQDAWAWGGMVVVSASMAGLVTLAALTQPALTLAPEARTSLLHYVTGRYLHPPSCKVEFDWEEPGTVGETLTLKVLCYQRDGQPYPVSDADRLLVTLTHRATDRSLAGVVSVSTTRMHEARVHVRTRQAGDYDLSVTIGVGAGAGAVRGSPFVVRAVAAGVSASTSLVARAGVLHVAGRVARLYVLPRDQFDNPALVTDEVLQQFSMSLTPLGSAAWPEPEPDTATAPRVSFTYDNVNARVVASVVCDEARVYAARVCFRGELVQDGEFDCIVLSPSDATEVIRCVNSISCRLTIRAYEQPAAPLVLDAGSNKDKRSGQARRVTLKLTSRALSVQTYWLNVIPQPPRVYPITHYTQLVLEAQADARGAQFSVSDGGGGWRRLCSPQRDMLAATLQALRHRHDAHSFASKQEELYASLRPRRSLSLRRRGGGAGGAGRRVSLSVSRGALLSSSLAAVTKLRRAHWRNTFHITFEGEQGVDWGGLSREWFSLMCRQLFSPETGLFHSYRENGLMLPRHHTETPYKLKVFETAGRLVGKCVYESARGVRTPAPLRLARSLLAQLQGAPVTYKHFEQDDPELYMTKIKYILESDLESDRIELYFTDDEFGADGTFLYTHELVPNGANIRVTNANKLVYLSELARWRLAGRSAESTRAFIKGVHCLIPASALQPFNETELELVVCGVGALCVWEWRAHSHVLVPARRADWFWCALHALSHAERARLLQFTTGCTHLPPSGFQDLSPKFTISSSPLFNALPTAHTCFNQLCLPDYDSYEHLLKSLLTAINEGEGFGLV